MVLGARSTIQPVGTPRPRWGQEDVLPQLREVAQLGGGGPGDSSHGCQRLGPLCAEPGAQHRALGPPEHCSAPLQPGQGGAPGRRDDRQPRPDGQHLGLHSPRLLADLRLDALGGPRPGRLLDAGQAVGGGGGLLKTPCHGRSAAAASHWAGRAAKKNLRVPFTHICPLPCFLCHLAAYSALERMSACTGTLCASTSHHFSRVCGSRPAELSWTGSGRHI
mmetsp:Transcript_20308/g.63489  ORF Transcript_20308/g.63489 Transcript_20308/m.63489 type:complete len:220 (+) Transcript_20308:562-1221(+)